MMRSNLDGSTSKVSNRVTLRSDLSPGPDPISDHQHHHCSYLEDLSMEEGEEEVR